MPPENPDGEPEQEIPSGGDTSQGDTSESPANPEPQPGDTSQGDVGGGTAQVELPGAIDPDTVLPDPGSQSSQDIVTEGTSIERNTADLPSWPKPAEQAA